MHGPWSNHPKDAEIGRWHAAQHEVIVKEMASTNRRGWAKRVMLMEMLMEMEMMEMAVMMAMLMTGEGKYDCEVQQWMKLHWLGLCKVVHTHRLLEPSVGRDGTMGRDDTTEGDPCMSWTRSVGVHCVR